VSRSLSVNSTDERLFFICAIVYPTQQFQFVIVFIKYHLA
jgi:hypothetical protein